MSKTVLGKSLGGLLSDSLDSSEEDVPGQTLQTLRLTSIQRGKYQPRIDIDPQALSDLADSIRAQGVVQPIVVRQIKGGGYEIIAGERRFRAAKLAGLSEIPAVIREMNDETALVIALVENIQRQSLNAVEEANALSRLIEEFTLTHQEVSTLVGKSRASVTNSLRLLTLSPKVQALLVEGKIEAGHAKMLVGMDEVSQLKIAEEIITKQLSVRQTEQRVREFQQKESRVSAAPEKAVAVREIETKLTRLLGSKVHIQSKANGKGRLVISYDTMDELNNIASMLEV